MGPPARALPPKPAVSTQVNRLKSISAHYLRKQFPAHVRKYLWDNQFWWPS
ncbi:transposase [Actinomadura sp. CNU-125]|uniref:transposase n=1 Tax=Actinomadura sp. CNU-125 TaxID=1904961 RepID=UPI0013011CE3